MTRINSPADLNALRDSAIADIDLRRGPKDIRITVHMGTCGIAAGAREVLAAIMQELKSENVPAVTIQQAGCVGLCDQEPMITVTAKGGEIYRYGRLDRIRTREVVRSHILRGVVLQDCLIRD